MVHVVWTPWYIATASAMRPKNLLTFLLIFFQKSQRLSHTTARNNWRTRGGQRLNASPRFVKRNQK